MRLRTAAALACLLSVASFAPPPAALAQHRQGLQLNEELRFPAGRDTVSLPFENHGEHILIRVSVNGGAPLLMVFDTGMPAPGVLLYEGALVDRLALTYSPAQIQVGGAGGAASEGGSGSRSARLATGVTLRVGGLEVGGSVAIVMPSIPQMSGLHDGIIGASLFQNLVVSLDHDRGLMTLTRRSAFTPPKAAAEVPLEVRGRHAYVPLKLVGADGKATPIRTILDLGATHALSLNRRSNPAIVAPPGARTSRIGRGMSGVVTGLVGRLSALELGGHRLTNLVATFPDSAFENPSGLDSMNGNLGGGVLGRFNLSLDVGGSRMFLTPNQRFSNPFEWDMSGLQTEITDGGEIRVAAILQDSPAAEAGITPGETVVAVDGAKAVPRTLLRTRERFREPGRELALTLRKEGRERVVKLRLRRLV